MSRAEDGGVQGGKVTWRESRMRDRWYESRYAYTTCASIAA